MKLPFPSSHAALKPPLGRHIAHLSARASGRLGPLVRGRVSGCVGRDSARTQLWALRLALSGNPHDWSYP